MHSPRLYLDNAATSFPKPSAVLRAMHDYAAHLGASPGRGAYAESQDAAEILASCRQLICQLISATDPDHVIFTLNTTDALNQAIKGVVYHAAFKDNRKPVHVITTHMDHNSILRPLNELAALGLVEPTFVRCDPATGIADPQDIADAIRDDTALVATLHASNVSGSIQPIEQIGAICKQRNVLFLVDAAQTLGHLPFSIHDTHADLLAFPGHKGLLGPLGTGGLYIAPGVENRMLTTREGGTGSKSEQATQPTDLPDRFESGSHNTLGIAGLEAGLRHILSETVAAIREHELSLIKSLLDTFSQLSDVGYTLHGPTDPDSRVGVFAFTHETIGPSQLAALLECDHNILGRPGLHCAPLAHATFGTDIHPEDPGTMRLSVGPFVTLDDTQRVRDALMACAQETCAAG